MRIVIERSGRSLIAHLAHISMTGLMIYGAFTKEDPYGYIMAAMWIIVSYVRYNMIVLLQSEVLELQAAVMKDVRKDIQKFLKENKEHLINRLREEDED